MIAIDRRRYEMLGRVRDFGASYGQLFPESSLASKAFAVVARAVAEIEARDLAQTTASVSARSTRKKKAREALLERLRPLVGTARGMTEGDPVVREQFVIPKQFNDQQLVGIARQCLQRAAPMAEQFVAHGMPATFISDIKPLIGELDAALRDRGMSRDQLVEARACIRQALANAFTAIWQLDLIVKNQLTSNPGALEVWTHARRVAYPSKRRQTAAGQPEPADAVPAASPAIEPALGGGGLERTPLRGLTRAA
jgi:hypothetical protein